MSIMLYLKFKSPLDLDVKQSMAIFNGVSLTVMFESIASKPANQHANEVK